MRRQQLTETQIAELFDPPTDPRELIRHYTLSAGDLAIVHRCRGEHNRLGRALMLCYLRYPGRPQRAGERPPAELCGRLRAGDVWVVGSRRYRSFEEHLISREAHQEMLQSGTLPVALDPDLERFIAGRRARLDSRLGAVDAKATGGLLPDVSLEKGVLKIAPIEKSTPPEAEALAARLHAMLPRIRITDLLS